MISLEKTIGPGRPSRARVRTDYSPASVPGKGREYGVRPVLGKRRTDWTLGNTRLIHYTLQEYLSRPGALPNAHRILGQKCLTYLNYNRVKRLPANNVSNLEDMLFLEYSSLYWGVHAQMDLSDDAKSLALKLLDRYDSHISSVLLFEHIYPYWLRPASYRPFSGLHCASYLVMDTIRS